MPWDEILPALQQNSRSLSAVVLARRSVGDQDAHRLGAALAANTCVRSLDLRGNNLGPQGAKDLLATLAKNVTITRLDLENNVLGPEGAQQVAALLLASTSIGQLTLGSQHLGSQGIAHLASALERGAALTVLGLEGTSAGPEGARLLAEALRQNRTLRKLDLAGNGLGVAGALHLANALQDNQTLTDLGLKGNGIGDTGAAHLATVLSKNRSLLHLDLAYNDISESCVEQLRAAWERRPRPSSTPGQLDLRGNASDVALAAARAAAAEAGNGGGDAAAANAGGGEAERAAAPEQEPHEPAKMGKVSSIGRPTNTVARTAEEIDALLDQIEVCLKRVDLSQNSMVRLRKTEIDLLGQLDLARESIREIVKGGDRALLRQIFGGDCVRVARLRAALNSVHLSEQSVRDQRLAACQAGCSALEEILSKELNLAEQLEQATLGCGRSLLQARATLLLDPQQSRLVKAEMPTDPGDPICEDDKEDDDIDQEGDEDDEDDDDDEDDEALDDGILPSPGASPATSSFAGAAAGKEAAAPEEPASAPAAAARPTAAAVRASTGAGAPGKPVPGGKGGSREAAGPEGAGTTAARAGGAALRGSTGAAAAGKQPVLGTKGGSRDQLRPRIDSRSSVGTSGTAATGGAAPTSPANRAGAAGKPLSATAPLLAPAAQLAPAPTPAIAEVVPAAAPAPPPKCQGKLSKLIGEDTARTVFYAMDTDGDGELNLQELRLAYAGVLLSSGERVDKKRIARWAKRNLRKYDSNGSGGLDIEEFRRLLRGCGGLAPALAGESTTPAHLGVDKVNGTQQRLASRSASRSRKNRSRSSSKAAVRKRVQPD